MSDIFTLVVRTPKEDSAFLYFQLEANEGLCFYRTLPFNTHDEHRDIEMKGSIEFKAEVLRLLKFLESTLKIDYLSQD